MIPLLCRQNYLLMSLPARTINKTGLKLCNILFRNGVFRVTDDNHVRALCSIGVSFSLFSKK